MAKVKKREHEKLNPGNIRRVAKLLNEEKPITKKEACELLNISYNTKRLESIITQQLDTDERQKRRQAENRGKPATEQEIAIVVQDTLEGDPVKDIAERLARPASFVKNILARYGVPEKAKGDEKFKTQLLPDKCMAESFEENEIAWSALHNSPVVVLRDLGDKYVDKYDSRCYQVWVNEAIKRDPDKAYYVHSAHGGYNAFLPGYDLGKLDHIRELGVDIKLA